MNIIAGLAPFFALFEVAQIFMANRYIGINQIRANIHPLDQPKVPPFWVSTLWLVLLSGDYAFQVALGFQPFLIRFAALLLIFSSLLGFMLRRVCGLKLGLVVLTFEGAARMGFYIFIFYAVVFHLQPYSFHR